MAATRITIMPAPEADDAGDVSGVGTPIYDHVPARITDQAHHPRLQVPRRLLDRRRHGRYRPGATVVPCQPVRAELWLVRARTSPQLQGRAGADALR